MQRAARIARFLPALLAWSCCAFAHAADVLVVLGGDAPAYREVAACVTEELAQSGTRARSVQTMGVRELARGVPDSRLIIAVGTSASQAVAAMQSSLPVINTLLPSSTFERIARSQELRADDGRFSAVLLDQPVARYLDLLRAALPGRNRVAVLLGPDSEADLPRLTHAAAARRLKLITATARSEKEIHAALQELLAQSDVLLTLPDGLVSDSRTLPYILLTAYHARVPVIGFSPAYVTAGAMLAVYSTPRQIGCQSAETARQVLAGAALPPPQRPREFEIGVNVHVARSLDIAIDDVEVLRERISRHGAKR